MKNLIKRIILISGCFLVLISSMVQGVSINDLNRSKKLYASIEACNMKKDDGESKCKGDIEELHKQWENGSFEEVKKSVLEHLDGKIECIKKEIEACKTGDNKDRLERLEKKLEKVTEVREKVNSAKSKDDIKDIMHKAFKHKGHKHGKHHKEHGKEDKKENRESGN